MRDNMLVSKALADATKLSGMDVYIKGIFVMKKDCGYIVAGESDINRFDKAIYIDTQNLKKMLLSTVPALGGGEYTYCNEAIVIGALANMADDAFPCALVKY